MLDWVKNVSFPPSTRVRVSDRRETQTESSITIPQRVGKFRGDTDPRTPCRVSLSSYPTTHPSIYRWVGGVDRDIGRGRQSTRPTDFSRRQVSRWGPTKTCKETRGSWTIKTSTSPLTSVHKESSRRVHGPQPSVIWSTTRRGIWESVNLFFTTRIKISKMIEEKKY